jgi:hypothetical protein
MNFGDTKGNLTLINKSWIQNHFVEAFTEAGGFSNLIKILEFKDPNTK